MVEYMYRICQNGLKFIDKSGIRHAFRYIPDIERISHLCVHGRAVHCHPTSNQYIIIGGSRMLYTGKVGVG